MNILNNLNIFDIIFILIISLLFIRGVMIIKRNKGKCNCSLNCSGNNGCNMGNCACSYNCSGCKNVKNE
ncbi:hypothetical protein SAMN02910289_01857 [Lachnospiraceae bacterium RM5]|nr:hypothetical protein SAMN02910289_01857 [Lachnospiraceae bacterium RM5]